MRGEFGLRALGRKWIVRCSGHSDGPVEVVTIWNCTQYDLLALEESRPPRRSSQHVSLTVSGIPAEPRSGLRIPDIVDIFLVIVFPDRREDHDGCRTIGSGTQFAFP